MDTRGVPLLHPDKNELDPAFMMDGSCWQYIPVYSDGIWNKHWEDVFKHPFVLLQFQLSLIFILTSLIHFYLNRLYLPRIVSEILAGMILGRTVLKRFYPEISEVLFPLESVKILFTLTKFGYIFFMFLIGVKMDVKLINKSGKKAWIIGCTTLMIPMLGIVINSVRISKLVDHYDQYSQDWVSVIAASLMITSFPVVVCLLMHLKIINTELGHLALSSALVSDLMSVIFINATDFVLAIEEASLRVGLLSMGLCLVLVVIIVTVLRSMASWIIRRTPEEKPVKSSYTFCIVIALLLVVIIGDNVGLRHLYGAFIFGLAVPTGPPLASVLVEKLDTIISGLFLPLISFYCGYKSDIWALNRRPSYSILFVTTVGMIVKVVSVFIPAICCKMPLKDAAAIALIMTAKGIVELGTLANNEEKQPIDAEEFTMAILTVLMVAAIVPLCVRKLYDPSRIYTGYKKRNVMHTSNREELRILACAHRQDDATAVFKLLELSNSSTESPLSVYGLILQELKGGSTPLLINHQLGQKMNSSKISSFQPVVDVFNFFKLQHKKSVQVHVFTAISPLQMMDEDICWLAFDKSVSLTILPFHRKWNTKGKIILDDEALRTLNHDVLKKAPSSVGILVDRRSVRGAASILSKPSTYRVAMLYFGSEDDNETLAYAKRMAKCPRVHLTIIRFAALSLGNSGHDSWSRMLVDDNLRDIKYNTLKNPNLVYKEKAVRDGVDTAEMIQSAAKDYDLIMVGRRHNIDSPAICGLSEWSEFPELGPIGDLVAAPDNNSSVSVLVVQQQIIQGK